MGTDEAKALARWYYQEVLNNRADDLLAELFAANFIIHPPDGSSISFDAFTGAIVWLRGVFPDYQVIVQDQIAESERVVTRWTATGTHLGAFHDIAPTGLQVRLSGNHIDRLDGSKIVERWEQVDPAGMLEQLGA